MLLASLLFVVACTLWTLLGTLSVRIVTRRRAAPDQVALPPLTVLKPLCGADPSLEQSLESFFSQTYPRYEILLGVERADDPAIAVATRVMQRHPERASKLVVEEHFRGNNPKIRNLRGMIGQAAFDLVVISDSNVRAPAHYLTDLAKEYLREPERVGLVTNLVHGGAVDGIGGGLESVQLVGFCAAGIAGPSLVGEALVMGKSMMFSRGVLNELGGFESLANVLAEDYVMGKMFQHAGYAVRVAPTVLENVTAGTTVGSFVERQRRWAMLRCRLRPLAYLFEPLTSPLAVLPFAYVLLGPWAVAWALSMLCLRDVGQWLMLSGPRDAWVPMLLSVPREVLALWVWARAPFCRHVAWRGHRVRLSSGSLAYASDRAR